MSNKFFQNDPKHSELVARYEALIDGGEPVLWNEDELLDIIRYYEREHLYDRALDVADHGIEQFQFTIDFYLQKAKIEIACRRPQLAISTLDKAFAVAPNALGVNLLRVEAYASLGLYEDAHRLIEVLKELASPQDLSQIFLAEALIFEHREDYTAMFHTLQQAVLHDPENENALERLWICVELSKNYEESITFHEALLEEHPFLFLAWYNLAHAYSYQSQYEEAIEAFEYAFLINEDFEFAYRDYAELCYELNKFQQALKVYEEVEELFTVDTDLFLQIGRCHKNLNNIPVAKIYFEKARRLDALNDEVFFHLGECYAAEGNYQHAVRLFHKAIQIEDRREEYFAALAEAYFKLEKYEQAEPYFREAAEVAPETAEYWLRYASFLMEMHEYEAAIEVLEEAEDYTVGAELSYCYVACLFAMGRRQEALYRLGDVLLEDFDMYEALFDLMPLLEEDREVQAVIATFRPFGNEW